ncbi:hypothetical protein DACRYDRAFT_26272, partial [Dacryopinax primogenitus]
LSAEDEKIFTTFYMKMNGQFTNVQYNTLNFTYPDVFYDLPYIERCIQHVSGMKPITYDCCINSCVAYIGALAKLKCCPHCSEPRFKMNGKPAQPYHYLLIIPQLQAQYANV